MLQITRSADRKEIKSAYRRMAKLYHPDVNPNIDTTEQFQEINRAYEVLSDPTMKRKYDLFGEPGLDLSDEDFVRQEAAAAAAAKTTHRASPFRRRSSARANGFSNGVASNYGGYKSNGYQSNGHQSKGYYSNGHHSNGYHSNGYSNGYHSNGYGDGGPGKVNIDDFFGSPFEGGRGPSRTAEDNYYGPNSPFNGASSTTGGGTGRRRPADVASTNPSYRRTAEAGGGSYNNHESMRGNDLHFDMEIDKKTAMFGGRKEIRIRHLDVCSACNGHGVTGHGVCMACDGQGVHTKTRLLNVTIPGNVKNGGTNNKLRLEGEGDAGWNGGRPGDLYIYLTVKADARTQQQQPPESPPPPPRQPPHQPRIVNDDTYQARPEYFYGPPKNHEHRYNGYSSRSTTSDSTSSSNEGSGPGNHNNAYTEYMSSQEFYEDFAAAAANHRRNSASSSKQQHPDKNGNHEPNRKHQGHSYKNNNDDNVYASKNGHKANGSAAPHPDKDGNRAPNRKRMDTADDDDDKTFSSNFYYSTTTTEGSQSGPSSSSGHHPDKNGNHAPKMNNNNGATGTTFNHPDKNGNHATAFNHPDRNGNHAPRMNNNMDGSGTAFNNGHPDKNGNRAPNANDDGPGTAFHHPDKNGDRAPKTNPNTNGNGPWTAFHHPDKNGNRAPSKDKISSNASSKKIDFKDNGPKFQNYADKNGHSEPTTPESSSSGDTDGKTNTDHHSKNKGSVKFATIFDRFGRRKPSGSPATKNGAAGASTNKKDDSMSGKSTTTESYNKQTFGGRMKPRGPDDPFFGAAAAAAAGAHVVRATSPGVSVGGTRGQTASGGVRGGIMVGDDVMWTHEVDWATAKYGGEIAVEFQHLEALGQGERLKTVTRQIRVAIPPNVEDGNRLYVQGEGDAGPNGGPSGDLYIYLKVMTNQVSP